MVPDTKFKYVVLIGWGGACMDVLNNRRNNEELNSIILNERLNLTLAFSKRYHKSTAVCYLRIQIPLDLLNQKDLEIETVLGRKVETRLKRTIRDFDTVIRVNNSDFVIIIADITEYDCQVICKRLIGSVAEAYTVNFHHFTISSNMGICMYPYGSEQSEELINLAKMQMYEAKGNGKNRYLFYNGELNNTAYRKMLIENDLPYAIQKGQLSIQHQPQYHLKNRQIVGSEALVRWNHPSLGEIPPGEFINLAEAAGVINSLFYWTFKEVCKNIASKKELHKKYSINISVNQLLLEQLIPEITSTLNDYSVSASQITLEITENIKIYTVKKVYEQLCALKKLGFTIALDDFGNGYFSFADFIKLPIDYLKLDRNFVFSLMKNKTHVSVIEPIIQMAHNLGLQVIIEGIEDDAQFLEWANLDCDIIQGYFVSKPISFEEYIRSVDEIEERIRF